MQQKKGALGFIFITVLLDVIGWGIIIPVVPGIIQELTGGTVSDASVYGGWLIVVYALMQFVCAPIVGGLSDRYGRRPVLLASLFCFGLDYLFTYFAPTIAWLFVGRALAGVMGASVTTATAYIADVSLPEKRAQNFGIIGAAFGLGFILGPLIGSLLGPYGLRIPFLAAAGLTFLNWLYGFFILPESLQPQHRRPFDWKRANPVGSLKQIKKYPVITGLIASLVLIYISSHAVQSNWSFFTMEALKWDERMVGFSLAVVGFVFAIVQGVLIRLILPKIGNQRGVYLGLAMSALGFILFAFATESWMIFAITVVYCMGGIAGPALQGIISTQVPPSEQGELQGALTSLVSVTMIIGPLVMTQTFAAFTGNGALLYLPGAPMLLAGLLTIIASLMARSSLKKNLAEAHLPRADQQPLGH
jgi:MFS transporter, DHA1 family, tetracycline resistance protein